MKRHNRPGWRHLAQSVFVLCGLAASVAWADTLKPFTTDGCSSFPDGTPWQQTLWLDCCVKHDIAYWIGGTKEESPPTRPWSNVWPRSASRRLRN
ncbi:hypothetical protein [Niveibacterium sp. COAC-50]|uniref:hypothetical protein n=1 Tax=Niveibacterium sp. COAC-50 TaxID=2729384 RepID=UPI001C131614|nr:hypothetical protein [Niveibacterium sp. COAC-50]